MADYIENEIFEKIFKSGICVYKCTKQNIPVNFSVPSDNGTIITHEASQSFNGRNKENGNIFHVLVDSKFTRAYPITVDEFLLKYYIAEAYSQVGKVLLPNNDLIYMQGDGTRIINKGIANPYAIPVEKIISKTYGKLKTSWGFILPFYPGSFIIRYKENDFAVIDPSIFSKTYIYI